MSLPTLVRSPTNSASRLDPQARAVRFGIAVLALKYVCGVGERDGRLIDRQPSGVNGIAPFDIVELRRLRLLRGVGGIAELKIEDDVRIVEGDRPSSTRRGCLPAAAGAADDTATGAAAARTVGSLTPDNAPSISSRVQPGTDPPGDACGEIDRFLPRQTPRRVERHRLLNLVDQIRKRTPAPVRKEVRSRQRRPDARALH